MTIASLTQARRAVGRPDAAEVTSSLRFADGDHWQEGDGWSGPIVSPDDTSYAEVRAEIARAFVSQNVIREVTDRHVSGVVGREPSWSLTPRRALAEGEQPTAEERALIDEAEALLTAWWYARGIPILLADLARHALLGGRSCARFYVPSGYLDEGGAVAAQDAADALSSLWVDAVPPLAATVATDARTRRDTGIYVGRDPDARREYAEVSAVEGALTVTRVLGLGGEVERAALDLGGRLPLHELRLPTLITAQVRALQRLLNLALSMLGRNTVLGGFLERVILNAQLPGRMVEQPDGTRAFERDPFIVGAGSTNVLVGVPVHDGEGNISGYTSPSVVYRDPVAVGTFRDTRDEAYRAILSECRQLHALIAADATASGESRRQALYDFLTSLRATKGGMDTLGRWLLETALAYAAAFGGQPGRYDGLRAVFACRLDPGPVPADESRLVLDLVEGGLLSREGGMERAGVEDVDAEQARIEQERAADHLGGPGDDAAALLASRLLRGAATSMGGA